MVVGCCFMISGFTDDAKDALMFSKYAAFVVGRDSVATTHLVLGLGGVLGEARDILSEQDIDFGSLYDAYRSILVPGEGGYSSVKEVHNGAYLDVVIARARDISAEWKRFKVGGKSLLYGIVHEKECDGAKILEELKFDAGCFD